MEICYSFTLLLLQLCLLFYCHTKRSGVKNNTLSFYTLSKSIDTRHNNNSLNHDIASQWAQIMGEIVDKLSGLITRSNDKQEIVQENLLN
jgi:hypothetical protein